MIIELIKKNKTEIIKNWTRFILETYPVEVSKFLEMKKDRFSNPVGFAISNTAESIFNEIVGERDFEKIKLLLNDIIKIRAIQNFSPSSATEFIFSLKKVMRDEIEDELSEKKNVVEFSKLESVIDRIALTAFDLYMEAKEKVFKIRVNEIKAGSLHVVAPVNES